MLTKAILTGGVLSLLAGSAVYFGTEGADAQETNAPEVTRIEESVLAGAAEVAIEEGVVNTVEAEGKEVEELVVEEVKLAEADVQDPQQETSKPKTKWLDQYLKKTKPQTKSDDPVDVEIETASDVSDVEQAEEEAAADLENALKEVSPLEEMASEQMANDAPDADLDRDADRKTGRRVRVRDWIEKNKMRQAARDEEQAKMSTSEEEPLETLEIDEEMDIEIHERDLAIDSDRNIEVRVIKKRMGDGVSWSGSELKSKAATDYAPILAEAKKLLVTDMRNQAFLEIIDHAIDQDDVSQAADIVEELSTPELRDTARARIGTGLARAGDQEAAFAVLDEIEIDELSAPIRLEIITALMATKAERATPNLR